MEGFAMGATTKSISGLFANVCGRFMREQIAAGHGTRSAAAQGYLSLSLSWLSHFSWRDQFAWLDRLARLDQARDQARWLLKRLGGEPSSAFSNRSGLLPNVSGILSPARCPAPRRSQAAGRPLTGAQRFQG
jgi:hypothetical protein